MGEIGLDRVRGGDTQAAAFAEQIAIAAEMGRPVSVHMVGMEKEASDIISGRSGGVPVIIHGFYAESYSKRLVGAGCYLSVGPRLLGKGRDRVRRILSSIPEDRLLIETDAPHYGGGFTGLADLYGEFAAVLGKDPEELGATVTENMRRIHGRVRIEDEVAAGR